MAPSIEATSTSVPAVILLFCAGADSMPLPRHLPWTCRDVQSVFTISCSWTGLNVNPGWLTPPGSNAEARRTIPLPTHMKKSRRGTTGHGSRSCRPACSRRQPVSTVACRAPAARLQHCCFPWSSHCQPRFSKAKSARCWHPAALDTATIPPPCPQFPIALRCAIEAQPCVEKEPPSA